MKHLAVVLVGTFAMVLSGEAQVPANLSLQDALELARERNPAYRRAVARADATGADIMAGVGAFLPNLTGSVNFSGTSSTVVTGIDDFGMPIELPNPLTFRNSATSQGLSTNITLFDGLQNLHNLRGARAGANAAHAAVDAEAANLEAEVKRRFYMALRYRELIVLEETLLEARRVQLASTARLFRIAARIELDDADLLAADAAGLVDFGYRDINRELGPFSWRFQGSAFYIVESDHDFICCQCRPRRHQAESHDRNSGHIHALHSHPPKNVEIQEILWVML